MVVSLYRSLTAEWHNPKIAHLELILQRSSEI